jgi:hypothetical protein
MAAVNERSFLRLLVDIALRDGIPVGFLYEFHLTTRRNEGTTNAHDDVNQTTRDEPFKLLPLPANFFVERFRFPLEGDYICIGGIKFDSD